MQSGGALYIAAIDIHTHTHFGGQLQKGENYKLKKCSAMPFSFSLHAVITPPLQIKQFFFFLSLRKADRKCFFSPVAPTNTTISLKY